RRQPQGRRRPCPDPHRAARLPRLRRQRLAPGELRRRVRDRVREHNPDGPGPGPRAPGRGRPARRVSSAPGGAVSPSVTPPLVLPAGAVFPAGMMHEWTRGEYVISTDARRLDLAIVHGFLARAYWSVGLPRAVLERAVEHSLVFGLYSPAGQVGFARVVTDYATFAYLADVFVLEECRGRGLGKWLVEVAVTLPGLHGL